jgi:hypothetical protein
MFAYCVDSGLLFPVTFELNDISESILPRSIMLAFLALSFSFIYLYILVSDLSCGSREYFRLVIGLLLFYLVVGSSLLSAMSKSAGRLFCLPRDTLLLVPVWL